MVGVNGGISDNGAGIRTLYGKAVMSDALFSKFSALIYDLCGIKLNERKKVMLVSRLSKRLRSTGLNSFEEYYDALRNSPDAQDEIMRFIDAVSTNKTEFFRENHQFDLLSGGILGQIFAAKAAEDEKVIRLWSAGCSTGEEAYSLAITCAEFFASRPGTFRILATDISTRVLQSARRGVYPDSIIEPVPYVLRRKYLMRGKGDREGTHLVVPELRDKVTVLRHNLVRDNFRDIPMMDIIFCRNVVIYFDRETQQNLFRRLIGHLNPNGYLFMGHSESLLESDVRVQRVAPTVYRKLG